jgi:hypothetical protein
MYENTDLRSVSDRFFCRRNRRDWLGLFLRHQKMKTYANDMTFEKVLISVFMSDNVRFLQNALKTMTSFD